MINKEEARYIVDNLSNQVQQAVLRGLIEYGENKNVRSELNFNTIAASLMVGFIIGLIVNWRWG